MIYNSKNLGINRDSKDCNLINRIDITNAVDNINISIDDIESSISYLKETVDTLINNSNKRFEEDEIVLKSVEQKNINLFTYIKELNSQILKYFLRYSEYVSLPWYRRLFAAKKFKKDIAIFNRAIFTLYNIYK